MKENKKRKERKKIENVKNEKEERGGLYILSVMASDNAFLSYH